MFKWKECCLENHIWCVKNIDKYEHIVYIFLVLFTLCNNYYMILQILTKYDRLYLYNLGGESMKKTYNKLVRDNIPEIIRLDNKKCQTRILNDKDYILELKKKLCEKANEVNLATNRQEIIEDLKDVYSIDSKDIENARIQKANKNGKFEKKIFLEYVEEKYEWIYKNVVRYYWKYE